MRLFKYKVTFTSDWLAPEKSILIEGMVQIEPDVWSKEHIIKVIHRELFNYDPRYHHLELEQIPILG
jgi:hypothetical protein